MLEAAWLFTCASNKGKEIWPRKMHQAAHCRQVPQPRHAPPLQSHQKARRRCRKREQGCAKMAWETEASVPMCGSSIQTAWATARRLGSGRPSGSRAEGLEQCCHNRIMRTRGAAECFHQLLCGHLSKDVRVLIRGKRFEYDLQAGVHAYLATYEIQGKVSHHLQPIKLKGLKATV